MVGNKPGGGAPEEQAEELASPSRDLALLMCLFLHLPRPRVGWCRPSGRKLGLSGQTLLLSTVPTNLHGPFKKAEALRGNR